MKKPIYIYNSLSRKKEEFQPINPPHIGMYVCGPTVYSDPHLGHARPAITFDVVFRYFNHLGHKTRYVRNITDVGHLENDADEGEDKIQKKARVEQLEPMEVVQRYTDSLHRDFEKLNVLPPSIEPRATGHIIEQQEMAQQILDNGFAYEVNGSVYFDVEKYNESHQYGKLSGRVLDELQSSTRALDGQEEKKNSFDFALWKKASPAHIMRWPSRWSTGFPGWHLECSTMSTKYLGQQFDIHGGGMDLKFPHHECEIAQSVSATGVEAVKYWMHNNMITIDGQKMSKSLGNFITLDELFSGSHQLLEKAYSPMTVRFFILQAHYRSTLDFSNEALQAAEKGMKRLFAGIKALENLQPAKESKGFDVKKLENQCYEALNDDFNTPVLIAHLFDGVRLINSAKTGTVSLSAEDLARLKKLYHNLVFDILGMAPEEADSTKDELLNKVVDMVLNMRLQAKKNRDFASADYIRDQLTGMGLKIKDTKDGFEWELD